MKYPDLNLLRHFDALLSNRSVSRAAQELDISQPAMSAALSRLRRLFNDPLLLRDRGTWQPTARAMELHRQFRPLLDHWVHATQVYGEFDPARSARRLTLYATDYVQFSLLPHAIPRLLKEAPHFHLQVVPARPQHGLSMLDTNHVELIAGYFPDPTPDLRARFLYEETAVCLVREDHPCLAQKWSVDAYVRWPHVDLSAHTRYFSNEIDSILLRDGRRRELGATLSSYMVCPYVVANSNLIATLPMSVARALQHATRTVVLEVPFTLPSLSVSLYWHERYQDDAGHAWLRQFITDCVASLDWSAARGARDS